MSALYRLRSTLRPRACPSSIWVPSQPVTASRAFSLWPSSTPQPSASEPPVSLPPNPAPPLLLHNPPPDILNPTFFEPASNILLALPPSLGLSYAAFIPVATIVVRLCTTLPITLWQRRRTRRLVDVVMPLVREGQRKLSYECRDECRRKGMSFEQYQDVFKKRVSNDIRRLRYWPAVRAVLQLDGQLTCLFCHRRRPSRSPLPSRGNTPPPHYSPSRFHQ
jgi:inner membrane protein COX18